MLKKMMLLVVAALIVLALSAPVAFAAKPVPPGCVADGGTIICTETVPGKNKNFEEVTTTTTQGNLTNFSPEPQGVGTDEDCNRPGQTEKCPPGQF